MDREQQKEEILDYVKYELGDSVDEDELYNETVVWNLDQENQTQKIKNALLVDRKLARDELDVELFTEEDLEDYKDRVRSVIDGINAHVDGHFMVSVDDVMWYAHKFQEHDAEEAASHVEYPPVILHNILRHAADRWNENEEVV